MERSSREFSFPISIRMSRVFTIAFSILIAANSGCIRFVSNMLYVLNGRDTPAEFNELEEKKVAVMVRTNGLHSAEAANLIMARNINLLLGSKVKKIKMASQDEVERTIQDMSLSEVDPVKVGSRLGVDYVLDVEINDLKLMEGKTLYKGRCTSAVSVYNVAEGRAPVFRKSFPEYVYPSTGAPITDFDEATFQRVYLMSVAERIARVFYPYDPATDVARDAAISSISGF